MADNNVYLFVPNLIGYARVVLGVGSLLFMPYYHVIAATFYIISGLLDAFDGHAARALNQSSKFGAMLDMLTDRCATMCLLATLCHFYPSFMFFFQMVMVIDISCHWIHLHTSTMMGKTSHKNIDKEENTLLRFYYTNRIFLFFMCAGNELFYAFLYLLHFTDGWTIFGFSIMKILLVPLFFVAVLKVVFALMQGAAAWYNIGQIDIKERVEAAKKE
uniref:CDP-diacylglycerol--inositol 3-phosphatidyltransferase n=1 Tax=Moina brachiata TaxID=675436 RepID=A0A4Y7NJ16_9CRUS|nr:EOG090X0BWK [Moina brachiata]SVE93219.1 EOG090X0BWK [Moina brachiata]